VCAAPGRRIDLVPGKADQDRIRKRINAINSTADIVSCTNCEVDLAAVLNLKAFDLERILSDHPSFLPAGDGAKRTKVAADEHSHDEHDHSHDEHDHSHDDHSHDDHSHDDHSHGDHSHGDHAHSHTHDDRVSSVGFRVEGNLHEERFNAWLSPLLQDHGPDIYRMKGVLAFAGKPDKFVFQGVHMIFTGEPVQPWKEGERRESRLVFIGKELAKLDLEAGFKACLATAEEVAEAEASASAEASAEASAATSAAGSA
jgi:G3E family GTPase